MPSVLANPCIVFIIIIIIMMLSLYLLRIVLIFVAFCVVIDKKPLVYILLVPSQYYNCHCSIVACPAIVAGTKRGSIAACPCYLLPVLILRFLQARRTRILLCTCTRLDPGLDIDYNIIFIIYTRCHLVASTTFTNTFG